MEDLDLGFELEWDLWWVLSGETLQISSFIFCLLSLEKEIASKLLTLASIDRIRF